MKPRPPTLRTKYRYLLVQIVPPHVLLEPKQVYYAFLESVSSIWGDAAAAEIQMSVMSCERGHVIVRCQRGKDRILETAIATVHSVNGKRVGFHSKSTSGTMRALRRKIPEDFQIVSGEEYTIGGKRYESLVYHQQKIDLIIKGIKNEETLYFTHAELEELNATTVPNGI